MLFKCNICGKTFTRTFSLVKRNRFRCAECGIRAGAKKLKYTKDDVARAISSNGYMIIGEYEKAHLPVLCKCSRGHEFNLYFSEFLHSGRGCPQCAIIEHSGENHPNWKGGISLVNDYFRKKIVGWKIDILKASNYKCDISHICSKDLEVHHLINFSDLVKQAYKNANISYVDKASINSLTQEELNKIECELLKLHTSDIGVVLTQELHKKFHSQYGIYNNTPE